jgi:hypothetical protein
MVFFLIKHFAVGQNRSIKNVFSERLPAHLSKQTEEKKSEIAKLREKVPAGSLKMDPLAVIDFANKEIKLHFTKPDSVMEQFILIWDKLSVTDQDKVVDFFSNDLQLKQLINPFDDPETRQILKKHLELGIQHLNRLAQSVDHNQKIEQKTEQVMKEWPLHFKKEYAKLSDTQIQELKMVLKNKMKISYLLQELMMTNEYFSRSLRYYTRSEIDKLPATEKTKTAFEVFTSDHDKTYCTPNSMMFVSLFRLLGIDAHFNLPMLEENKLFYANETTHANILVPVKYGFSFVLDPQDVIESKKHHHAERIVDSIRAHNKRDRSLSYIETLAYFYTDYSDLFMTDIKKLSAEEIAFAKQLLDFSMQMNPGNKTTHRSLGAYYLNFEKNKTGLEKAENHLLEAIGLNHSELILFNNLIKVYWQKLKLSSAAEDKNKILEKVIKNYLGRPHVLALNLETLRDVNDAALSPYGRRAYSLERARKVVEDTLGFIDGLTKYPDINQNQKMTLFLKLILFLSSLKPIFSVEDIHFEGKNKEAFQKYFLTLQAQLKGYLKTLDNQKLEILINSLIEDEKNQSGLKKIYKKYLKDFIKG